MNELEKINNIVSISSLEIAKLTGKNHFDVLRDIRKILIELEITESKFACSYTDGSGKANLMFNLPKREALILASGYSVKLRTLIIDKLEELSKPKIKELSRLEMAKMLVEAEEAKERLQSEITILKPKAETLDLIEDKQGLHSIRNTAKLLQIQESKFIEFCLDHKILFRDSRKQLIGFADKVNSKICHLKIVNLNDKVLTQTLFTNSGISWLSQYISKWQNKTTKNLLKAVV